MRVCVCTSALTRAERQIAREYKVGGARHSFLLPLWRARNCSVGEGRVSRSGEKGGICSLSWSVALSRPASHTKRLAAASKSGGGVAEYTMLGLNAFNKLIERNNQGTIGPTMRRNALRSENFGPGTLAHPGAHQPQLLSAFGLLNKNPPVRQFSGIN